VLEYLLEEIRMQEFPEVDNVKNVYTVYFDEVKSPIFPIRCKDIDIRELTIFYLLEYLLEFQTIAVDTFYAE
jgi:hypothetical protein